MNDRLTDMLDRYGEVCKRIPRRAFLRWLEYGSPMQVMTAETARLEFDRLRAQMMEELEARL